MPQPHAAYATTTGVPPATSLNHTEREGRRCRRTGRQSAADARHDKPLASLVGAIFCERLNGTRDGVQLLAHGEASVNGGEQACLLFSPQRVQRGKRLVCWDVVALRPAGRTRTQQGGSATSYTALEHPREHNTPRASLAHALHNASWYFPRACARSVSRTADWPGAK